MSIIYDYKYIIYDNYEYILYIHPYICVCVCLYIYELNIRVSKYIKQTLTDLKGEIDSKVLVVGDFYTLLTIIDRSSRWKINRKQLT